MSNDLMPPAPLPPGVRQAAQMDRLHGLVCNAASVLQQGMRLGRPAYRMMLIGVLLGTALTLKAAVNRDAAMAVAMAMWTFGSGLICYVLARYAWRGQELITRLERELTEWQVEEVHRRLSID